MKLLTLGGLTIDGATYGREKPLLLLAYLTLEGQQTRKHLAELFWPDASNPMNSLAQNLIRLRPLGNVVHENDKWVQAHIPCDATDFRTHHRAARTHDATQAYTGAFLHGVNLSVGTELEEWLLDTRATLAAEARAAHLTLAEHHHARGETAPATHHAELAYATPGADPIDPEDIPRVWRLLGHPDHPLAVALRREAADLGLTLPDQPAPTPPTVTILGRAEELAALRALHPGQVAWISGPPGIGKTTLLSALATQGGWRTLPGVNGLPLGTLEPLSPHPLNSTADAVNALRDTRLKIAIDGWEDCDPTTQAALTLAARQHPGATLVITAQQPPAVPTDLHLPLYSLSEHDLQDHPGLHAATAGHPILLAAHLRGAPHDQTLDTHLRLLGHTPRRLFLALAAQDTPHLNATRAALNLSAAELAGTLDQLTREGLTTPTGSVRATTPARTLLDAQPMDTALLHLHLARAHPKESAWPHWLKARALWEEEDETKCAADAHWYADQEMKRGYPAKAARTLEVAPQTDEVKLLRGWALIHSQVSSDEVVDLSRGLGFRGTTLLANALLIRGESESVEHIIGKYVPTNQFEYGNYYRLCGHLKRRGGDLKSAAECFLKSSLCSLSVKDEYGYVESLSHLLWVKFTLTGSIDENIIADGKTVIDGKPSLSALFYNNLSRLCVDLGDYHNAYCSAMIALESSRLAESEIMCATSMLNIGVASHWAGNINDAEVMYWKALQMCKDKSEIRLIIPLCCNLSEICGKIDELNSYLELLDECGHHDVVKTVRENAEVYKNAQASHIRSNYSST